MPVEMVVVPSRYRWRYEMASPYSAMSHTWTLVGALGGVHLHISDNGEEFGRRFGSRFSGGVEAHHRTPPPYMVGQPPSHDECHVLKSPCWHDGSSLIASEKFIPLFENGGSHQLIFNALVRLADEWFTTKTEDE